MSELTTLTSEYELASDIMQNYSLYFYNADREGVGRLDFNGPLMRFEGDADESAKLFFDLVAQYFQKRLEEEWWKGYEEAKR